MSAQREPIKLTTQNFDITIWKYDNRVYQNGLCFATREEAEFSAKDIYSRWLMATEWAVGESDDPVNYRIDLSTGAMTAVEVTDALTT